MQTKNIDEEILPLTSLRFIAAFYLFVFHIHSRWPLTKISFCCHLFDAGAVGMSLFFMLSGFVLAYRYRNSQISYKEYIIKRFARIYPIYATAALACIPWFGVDLFHATGNQFIINMMQSGILIFTNIFMIQAWFPQLFMYWNDGGSWSISNEAFFYILFPFILQEMMNKNSNKIALIAVVAYFFSIIPSFTNAVFDKMIPWVYYAIPFFRLPDDLAPFLEPSLNRSSS